jgi:WD40 repeat protein
MGNQPWVTRVRFSPDGTELITSCGDGRPRVWDWGAFHLKDELFPQPSALHDFAFTADRRWLVALSHEGLEVVDWRTKSPVGPLWNLKGHLNLELALYAAAAWHSSVPLTTP